MIEVESATESLVAFGDAVGAPPASPCALELCDGWELDPLGGVGSLSGALALAPALASLAKCSTSQCEELREC